MTHELRDVADGLWLWRTEHPDWQPGEGWEQLVTSTFVESRGERLVLDAEQQALVFADALTAPGGELRVWATPWHEERALPALRALLELPFEHVIVAHGEPLHDRAAYEQALERPPWGGESDD